LTTRQQHRQLMQRQLHQLDNLISTTYATTTSST